jgi:hypothetical protein
MRLETHEGLFVDFASSDDITRAVSGLTTVGEAYVILSDTSDDETYVQGAGTVREGFIIERRDGCAGEHYRGEADTHPVPREAMAPARHAAHITDENSYQLLGRHAVIGAENARA